MVEAAFDLVVLTRSISMVLSQSIHFCCMSVRVYEVVNVPGIPNGGGGNDPGAPGCCSNGLACPSAAYELVIESITDCAFSCPISAIITRVSWAVIFEGGVKGR